MSYQCPVCGYDKLIHPPVDFHICPSCGTEFEADDFELSHAQLRQRWIDNGKRWYSRRTPPPFDWNPDLQLQKLLKGKEVPATNTSIGIVKLNQTKFAVRRSQDYGLQIVTSSSLFVIGNSGKGTGVQARR